MSSTTAYLDIINKFLDRRSAQSVYRSGQTLKFWFLFVLLFQLALFACIGALKDKFPSRHQVINSIIIELLPIPVEKTTIPSFISDKLNINRTNLKISTNNVIALPGTDMSSKSAPIKELATKAAPEKSGQPILSNTMKIAGAPEKPSPTAPNQKTQSDTVTPFNDAINGGPKFGAGNGQETAIGSGNQTRTGNGGGGNDLTGTGGGQQIAMLPARTIPPAMGNIAPYRKEMMTRIAQKWQPTKHHLKIENAQNIIAIITIATDGQLKNCQLINSSGDEKLDKYATEIIAQTIFAPLPNWFKGQQLKFKVELAKVEAIKSEN